MDSTIIEIQQPEIIKASINQTGDLINVEIVSPQIIQYEFSEPFVPAIGGADGKSVELRNTGTKIQWRNVGDTDWIDLLTLDDLHGTDGVDGKPIEFQNTGIYIQWRYVGDVTWNNLIALSDLKGADGLNGINGSNGADGESIELQNNGIYVQWRYIGDVVWNNLIALSDLKGANGTNGTNGLNGSDGKSVEVQNNGTYIQWRNVGDSTWNNLIALSDLKGVDGVNGISYKEFSFILHRNENASVGTNKTNALIVSAGMSILKCYAYAKTAPVGNPLKFDINVNDNSIWSTQANRISIASGLNSGTQTVFNTTTLSEGDILTIDIDEIGSSVPGADIIVVLKCRIN